MKPAWSIKSKSFARSPLADALEFLLARGPARVDGVLSGLVALEARVNLNPLLATLSGARAQGEAQTTRLRDVLDRDRALAAAGAPLRSARAAALEVAAHEPQVASQQAEPAALAAGGEDASAPMRALDEAETSAREPLLQSPERHMQALASDARACCKEPICTRTMARLLAAQGHKQRALSIYDVLLASDDDPSLRAEAERLRTQESERISEPPYPGCSA